MDLFIGGRAVPWEYGEIPHSYLLQNDGTGKFTDVTDIWATGLSANWDGYKCIWFDIDKDGDKDLLFVVNGVALMHLSMIRKIYNGNHDG